MKQLLSFSAVFLLLLLPLFGQDDTRPERPRARALSQVQQVLNLNDTQIDAVSVLIDSRNQELRQISQEAREQGQVVHGLLNEPSPNPADIGTAILLLRETWSRRQQVEERFQSGFRALLRPEQLQTLDSIQNAARDIAAFRALGIISAPRAEPGFPPLRRFFGGRRPR